MRNKTVASLSGLLAGALIQALVPCLSAQQPASMGGISIRPLTPVKQSEIAPKSSGSIDNVLRIISMSDEPTRAIPLPANAASALVACQTDAADSSGGEEQVEDSPLPLESQFQTEEATQLSDEAGIRERQETNRIEAAKKLFRPVGELRIDIRDKSGIVPVDRTEDLYGEKQAGALTRSFTVTTVQWDSPQIFYRRLYFEDPLLERYGQSTCNSVVDVIRSGVHFSGSVVRWPFGDLINYPGPCDTPLGFCRPGSPVPVYRDRLFSR